MTYQPQSYKHEPYQRVVIRSYRLAVFEFLVVFVLGVSVGVFFDVVAKVISLIDRITV